MKPEQYSASCAAFIPPDCGDSNDDSNRSGQWQASHSVHHPGLRAERSFRRAIR